MQFVLGASCSVVIAEHLIQPKNKLVRPAGEHLQQSTQSLQYLYPLSDGHIRRRSGRDEIQRCAQGICGLQQD